MIFAFTILVMTCMLLETYFCWNATLGQWGSGTLQADFLNPTKEHDCFYELSYGITKMAMDWSDCDPNLEIKSGRNSWHILASKWCKEGTPCPMEKCDAVSTPIGFLLMASILLQVLLLWATIQRCTVYGDVNCQKIWTFLLVFISGGCLITLFPLFWICTDGFTNGTPMFVADKEFTLTKFEYGLPYYMVGFAACLNLVLGVLQMLLRAPYRNQDLKFENLEEYMEAGEAQPLPPTCLKKQMGLAKQISLFPKGAVPKTTTSTPPDSEESEDEDATDEEETPVSIPPRPLTLTRTSIPTEIVLEPLQRKATFAENPSEERRFFVCGEATPPPSPCSTHRDDAPRTISPRGPRSVRSIPRRSGTPVEVTPRAHSKRYDELSFARDYSSPNGRFSEHSPPQSPYGGRRTGPRAGTVHFHPGTGRSMTPAGRSTTPAGRSMTPGGRSMSTPGGRNSAPFGRSVSVTPSSYREQGGGVRSDNGYMEDRRRDDMTPLKLRAPVDKLRPNMPESGVHSSNKLAAQQAQRAPGSVNRPQSQTQTQTNDPPRTSANMISLESPQVRRFQTGDTGRSVSALRRGDSATSKGDRADAQFSGGPARRYTSRADAQFPGLPTSSSHVPYGRSSGAGSAQHSAHARELSPLMNASSSCSTSRGSQGTVSSCLTTCDTPHGSSNVKGEAQTRQRAGRTPSVVPVREESASQLREAKHPNLSRAKKWPT
eukprot:GEMP01002696.1.p1 GENE.GEMP01002696.1~~GEMP01002696.1.p1  ORF type:complete len:715 (+),score=143.08 GEMP01002696.1:107-2251(+)